RVKDVPDLLAPDVSEKEILEDYPDLEAEDIKACFRYAAALVFRVPCNSVSMRSCRLPWRGCCVKSGCDAFAVRDIGLPEANDAEIWRYAVQQQAAIITSASVRIKKLFQEISLVDMFAAVQNHR